MTRPDKRAARFGKAYRANHPELIDYAKLARNLRDMMPALRTVMANITQNLRSVYERWTYMPHIVNLPAPTAAELQTGTPLRIGLEQLRQPLSFDAFIAQADEVLAGHDAQRSTGEEWPYKERF